MEVQESQIAVATPLPARPRRRRRALAGAIAAAALVGLLAGGSNAMASSPQALPVVAGNFIVVGGAPASATAVDPAKAKAAFEKYTACMRDHGIDLPDPAMVESSAGESGTTTTGPVIGTGTGPGTILTGPISGAAPAAGSIQIVGSATVAGGAGIAAPVQDDAFVAADKACAPILEAAGIQGPSTVTAGPAGGVTGSGPAGSASAGIVVAGNDPAMAGSLKAYAGCMRTHGIDVPDPTVDATTGAVQLGVSGDLGSQAFKDANAACATGNVNFVLPPPPGN